jgi:hypothetical protein
MSPSISAAIDEAFAVPVEGWDFSWLGGRAHETPPPWDFTALARAAIADSRLTLDVDTGGGEFLEQVGPAPGTIVATEGHPPNVAVAGRRLVPLGVAVVQAASAPDNVDQVDTGPEHARLVLPFKDGSFDLVINRHSSYWPQETYRLLSSGGRFLTQQRGEAGTDGEAWEGLFDRPTHPHRRFDLAFATAQLERAGFVVERAEDANTPMVFRDLQGVVFYLRLVPWAVEGFDPERDRHFLERIQRKLARDGELRISGAHMLIDGVRR